MKLYSLCSSSKGNCTYIGDEKSGILIDIGFGIRNTVKSLSLAGIDPKAVQAVFVTHEHSDHISGLKKFTEKYDVPVFGSYGTLENILKKDAISSKVVFHEIDKKTAQIAGMEIKAFKTSHDSAQSLGFCVCDGKNKISICTDLGKVTDEVKNTVFGSSIILLESNYDLNMLQVGDYPYFLKERIVSEVGHLSNDDCAVFMEELIKNGTERFLLGHLSEKNNLPELAMQNAIEKLSRSNMSFKNDYVLNIAPARNNGKIYEVD